MRGEPRRPLLALVAIGTALFAANAIAGTPTPASNRRVASQDAPRLLAALQLPAGATGAAGDPSAGGPLAKPPTWPATKNLVALHRFWRVPGEPRAVLSWIAAHPPQGSQANMSGEAESRRGVTTSWEGFWFGPATAALSDRELLVTVARAKGGGTALRADAQVVWVTPRPAWERVPRGASAVTIVVHRLGKPASSPLTIAGAEVRRIAQLVNALPAAQPGPMSCPADFGPYVQLAFRSARSDRALATLVADGSGCGGVSFRLETRRGPPLSGGPGLIKMLQLVLHANLGLT